MATMKSFESGLLIGGGLLLSSYMIMGALQEKREMRTSEIEALKRTIEELETTNINLERFQDSSRFRQANLHRLRAKKPVPISTHIPVSKVARKAALLSPAQTMPLPNPPRELSVASTLIPSLNPVIQKAEPNSVAPSDSRQYSAEELMKAVVLIEGDESVGTGFFVKHATRIYLYTAAHVLSGNKTLSFRTTAGRVFKKFGDLEVAKGIDLVRMRVRERVPAALQFAEFGAVKLKKEILAIGNSGGGSVLTNASGVIEGIGDVSFEISAEVIQGNSGGPIILRGQNKVLGLVTHGISGRNDIWAEGTRYTDVRRFGARLDKKFEWMKLPLYLFLAEEEQLTHLNRVTRLLYALAVLRPNQYGIRLSTKVNGTTTARDILTENQSMNAVKSLMNMNNHLEWRNIKPDPKVVRKKFINYYRGILNASKNQVRSAQSLSPYHRDIAKVLLTEREKAQEALTRRLNSMVGR